MNQAYAWLGDARWYYEHQTWFLTEVSHWMPLTRFNPNKMNQIILFITAFVLYLLWFVITIALIITIIGWYFLSIMDDYGWFDIPNQIIDKTINP
jgi:hypothetical protein